MSKVLAASGLVFLFACVGGGGELPDQGPDQADQGGGIHRMPGSRTSGSSSDDRGGSTNPPSTATATPPPPPTQTQTIYGSEFERGCNDDSDCVVVFQGSACQACKCPNTVIASKDKSSYDSKLAERSTGCTTPANVQCSPCQSVTATCNTTSKRCSTSYN